MNTLTVNLHLLMATFYRPTARALPHRHRGRGVPLRLARRRLAGAPPRLRSGDRRRAPATARGRGRAAHARTSSAELERLRGTVALVLLGGVNYLTGELFEIPEVTAAAHDIGAVVGWDLAHAVGNVPLELSAWGVDWAAWCHYKYVNAGPGGPAGAFVHARHADDASLPRLAGWWGNDPATRFRMEPGFVPRAGGGRAGRSRRRPCSRSRRCASRSSSSTRSACRRCASARCASPATSRRCSTPSWPSAVRGCSRRATRRAAAASSRSPFPTRARSRRGCGPSTA